MTRSLRFAIAATFALSSVCAFADQTEGALSLYEKYKNPTAEIGNVDVSGIVGVRADMISEAAYAIGLRAGSAQRARDIAADLNRRQLELDRGYRFSVVLTPSGVFVPPVIAEIKDSTAVNQETLRLTKANYRIIKRGSLKAQPPNWREYLYLGLNTKEPPRPDAAVLPKTKEERALWDARFDFGWAAGIAVSDNIFLQNMARLERDLIGMKRYAELRDKGMMGEEVVVETQVTVRENSPDDISVDETTYRLKEQPTFQTNSAKWRLVPAGTKKP